LDAEKGEDLKQSKIARINNELALPAEKFKPEDVRAEALATLKIPEPEDESSGESHSDADSEKSLSASDEKPSPLNTTPHLKTEISLEDKIDAQILKGVQSSTSHPTRNVGGVRVDVARISADIQSGEELYRRAQMRIESLTQFVEHAEIDMAALKRLEPENRDLKKSNEKLTDTLNETNRKISILEANLEDLRKRLKSKDETSRLSQTRLAKASKSLHDYDLALKSAQQTAEQNYLKLERNETTLDVERRENKLLQEKMKASDETK